MSERQRMSKTEETPHRLGLVVRAYPTKEQDILFRKTVGCGRFVYNHLLDFRNKEYQRYLKWQKRNSNTPKSKFKWKPLPTEKQLKEKFEWLSEPNSQTLQQSRMDLNVAFDRFFKGHSDKPSFHKKGQKESFRIPQNVEIREGKLFLSKYGLIRIRGDLSQIRGKIKSATVKLEAGKWYVSILYAPLSKDYYQPVDHRVEAISIDLGVVQPLTITDGEHFWIRGQETREHLTKLETRRKRYQRQFNRKQRRSNNQHKTRTRIAKAFQKERNYRNNFQHQVSHRLTNLAETIIFEDLRIRSMTRSARGTQDNPGKNVRQKSGLNREMLRIGLSGLVSKCQYKAHRRGGQVLFVDPKFTSQTCSDCGTVDKRSRESQSRYSCVHCGFTLNADRNAALNILARGLAIQ